MSDVRRSYVYKDLTKPEGASYDEIIESLGLGFDAEKRPLKTADNNGNDVVIPDKVAVWRKDKDEYLATVGDAYGIVQYRQAFSIVEELLGEQIEVCYGGPVNRGESAVLVLRAPGELDLGNDTIINECALRSTHDGTGKIEVRMTPRCKNNGIVLTTDAMKPLSFKHTKRAIDRIADAKRTLRRVSNEWEHFTVAARKLMAINLNEEEGRSFIKSVVGDSESTQATKMRDKVYDLWRNVGVCSRIPVCRGTLFGLTMAFAEWADFYKTVRKSKRLNSDAAELNVRLVGDAAKKKAKAWSMALNLKKKMQVGV